MWKCSKLYGFKKIIDIFEFKKESFDNALRMIVKDF